MSINPVAWVKSHPYAAGGIVLVGGVAIFALSRMGRASSAPQSITVDAGPSDAQVMSNANLRMAELGLQQKQIETNASKEVSIAGISAQSKATETNAAAQIQIANINNATTVSQYNAQIQLAELNADTVKYQTLYDYKLGSEQTIASLQLGTLQSNNSLQLGLDTNATNKYLSDNQVIIADRVSDSLDLTTQIEKDIASIENDTARQNILSQERMNANTNKTNKSVAKTNAIAGVVGTIGKVIGSIFSDERLKTNITKEGELPSGVGLYSYQYLWSDDWHLGVMAQEVMKSNPGAVSVDPHSGAYMVNYGMVH